MILCFYYLVETELSMSDKAKMKADDLKSFLGGEIRTKLTDVKNTVTGVAKVGKLGLAVILIAAVVRMNK